MKTLFEKFARDVGIGFQMAISDVMKKDVGAGYVDTAPSREQDLQFRSGRLYKSFGPFQPGSLFSYTTTDVGMNVVVGSRLPYASIHETGGRIFAKRMVQTSRGLLPAMSLFFYRRFKETRVPYFFNLFLKVKRDRFVTIPKRNYFSKALQRFEKAIFPRMLGRFVTTLLQAWANKELKSE